MKVVEFKTYHPVRFKTSEENYYNSSMQKFNGMQVNFNTKNQLIEISHMGEFIAIFPSNIIYVKLEENNETKSK